VIGGTYIFIPEDPTTFHPAIRLSRLARRPAEPTAQASITRCSWTSHRPGDGARSLSQAVEPLVVRPIASQRSCEGRRGVDPQLLASQIARAVPGAQRW